MKRSIAHRFARWWLLAPMWQSLPVLGAFLVVAFAAGLVVGHFGWL